MVTRFTPGQQIGGYRLQFRLGTGGMGEVWAATRTQAELGFSKLIALKILQGHDLTSNAAVMFFDEARAAALLHHRHIVPTVDLGREGDLLFIAMEIVRGPSLTALLQRLVHHRGRISPAVVAHLGLALSSALDYAYNRATHGGTPLRIVHRDVSPHNVLLGVNGTVRLTDFGIARTSIQDHQSKVGTIRGKPSYMAPEQVCGEQVDGRTDLFALGIIMYEASSLRRLFGRGHPRASMEAVLRHTPRPLSAFDHGYPPQLWRVIHRALQKEPAARFQSAAEMHDAIRHAAVDIDGFPGAERELVMLVEQTFGSGAFDTGSPGSETRDFNDPHEDPTRSGWKSTTAWPSAQELDLREPETTPAPSLSDTPAVTARPNRREPETTPTPSLSDTPAVTARPNRRAEPSSEARSNQPPTPRAEPSSDPPPARRRRTPAAALILSGTAVLLTTAALGVTHYETTAGWRFGSPRRPTTPAPPEQRSPKPGVASPWAEGARGAHDLGLPRTRTPDRPTRGKSDPREARRRRPLPVHSAPPRPVPRRPSALPGPTPSRPSAPRPTPGRPPVTPRAPAHGAMPPDATFEEVRALLKRVRKVNPERGHALLVTLAEAGRNNPTKLNELRRQAAAILQRPPDRTRAP